MGELWDVLLQPVRRTEQGDWDPDDLEERHKVQSQVLFVKQCCFSDVQEDELDELDDEEDPEGQAGQTDKDNPPALLTADKAEKAMRAMRLWSLTNLRWTDVKDCATQQAYSRLIESYRLHYIIYIYIMKGCPATRDKYILGISWYERIRPAGYGAPFSLLFVFVHLTS